ncbi:MAG: PKD domain-containing protein [Candidatus Orphnella occulta]|nr:PKD domain-containing protein [Candidatus Orphnella occulta]
MFKKALCVTVFLLSGLSLLVVNSAVANNIPEDRSKAKYFYVFGAEGDPLLGAEDNEFTLFIDVPKREISDLTIEVYDPDTGSHKDFRTDSTNLWDTVTGFSIYGDDLIASREFGSGEYNRAFYMFGPYSKTQGQEMENAYRFKVVVKGLSGDDANLFRFRILPDSAECFSEDITIRLLHHEGDKMYFYPQVSANTEYIILENYDLDVKGGTSEIFAGRDILFGESKKEYNVVDSPTGEWRKTEVPVNAMTGGRLKYVITKGTQKYAHAGIKVYDDKGNILPIYFTKGDAPIPVIKGKPMPATVVKAVVKPVKDITCNKFTFDATDSYDIDNQKLSFDWSFGDGETSTESVIKHLYKEGGEYTVTLTVTDNSGLDCDTATTTQTIKVNTPPKAAFSYPESLCVGDEIIFDASETQDDSSSNLSYYWDLGDGAKVEGVRVAKIYERGGLYKISLTVDDNEDSSCSTDTIQQKIRVNTSPVADAGGDVDICLEDYQESYKVTFNGSGSYDADKDKLTYSWNLGDGTLKEGKIVTHIYDKPGTYKATLTVDDGSGSVCSEDMDSVSVDLNKTPSPSIHTRDSKICVGDEVVFDGSESITEDGESLSYIWEFGDGTTGQGVKTTHAYKKGGRYYPRLTVNDNRNTRCSEAVATVVADVNSAPIASIDAPRIICIGKSITIDGSDSNDPDGDSLQYFWDLGDGSTQFGSSSVRHTYKKGGFFTVKLTVDDGREYACSTSVDIVNIRVNTPPVANSGLSLACCVDTISRFDGSNSYDPDGDILTYEWDFGDGTGDKGASVFHVYTKPGRYRIVLTVDDGSGTECNSDVSSFTATVNAKPVPIIRVR